MTMCAYSVLFHVLSYTKFIKASVAHRIFIFLKHIEILCNKNVVDVDGKI